MEASPRARLEQAARWRLAAFAVAVALIVLVPYFFAQRAVDSALADAQLVTHTAEVKAELSQLTYLVRDMEAASLALAAGLSSPLFRERIGDAMQRLAPQLEKVKGLLSDNPQQLVRLGELGGMIEGRRRLTEEAVLEVDTGRFPEALAALQRAADQFRIRGVIEDIVAVEEALLDIRTRAAERTRRAAEWLSLLAATAQLVLLGVVIWLWERQNAHRLQAERNARKAVSRAQAIFQSVRDPILLLDPRLRVLMHNSAFEETYGGTTRSDGATMTLGEVGQGEWSDAVLLQRLTDVATRDRELWDHELRQRQANGQERDVVVNARRMRLPDAEDSVVLMTVADLTAHKRAEYQVRELNRQLEGKVEQVSEVNRELEAFSYSVSHDLRAPLRHIAGFADKLGRHLGDHADDKARHYLDIISGSATRMAGLIDDLLVYSRLGRHALRLQPVDMQTLVEETRLMLTSDLGERRVEWRIQPLPIVVADENMMRQVWQNLLGNALKYSVQRELTRIEITSRTQDDGVMQFTVRDNGAGFDMAYAGKLFGVFQRLHKASEFAGSGIGLANVRRILARHGGRIWAEAEPDKGAVFHFTLPSQPGHTREPGTPA
jgi:PAS domain S-box-containing protein